MALSSHCGLLGLSEVFGIAQLALLQKEPAPAPFILFSLQHSLTPKFLYDAQYELLFIQFSQNKDRANGTMMINPTRESQSETRLPPMCLKSQGLKVLLAVTRVG